MMLHSMPLSNVQALVAQARIEADNPQFKVSRINFG
jgi:hypothetical protein